MKKVYLLLLILLVPALSACTTKNEQVDLEVNKQEVSTEILEVDEEGSTSFNEKNLNAALDDFSYSELTDLEKEGIVFMIEEEKLAHDVYAFLYDKWGVSIFNNISGSELTHTTAVQNLAQRYQLVIPESIDELGKYENADLQKLYDDLVAIGSKSLEDAFLVGTAIEEIDILDLEKYIAQTEKEDIKLVYENLLKGSRNHLRSFVKNIEKNGDTYEQQYMDKDAYDAIVSSDTERGSGRGSGQGGRGR